MQVAPPVRTSLPPLALMTALGLALLPAPAAAQTITGTVVDAGSNQPIAAAEIWLRGPDDAAHGKVTTDEAGRFTIQAPGPGAWALTVQRIGFASLLSEPLPVNLAEWVVLEIALAADAIALEPIVVTARRSTRSPDVQRFYDRRDRSNRSGLGHFIVREDIERLSPHRPTDLLRTTPGIRVVRGPAGRGQGVRMSTGCIPAIYIDGMPLNRSNRHDSVDDYVTVLDIEGIEVYRGASSQLGQYYDPSGCGLVLVWTRGGHYDPDRPFRWRTVLGGLAALGLFLFLAN
jgi:outer membrane receptor protein involved in Fe transport